MTMKLTQVRDFAAACGVILSLLFVGYQIHQNTQVARATSRQELASLNQDWLILQSQDSTYNAIWEKAWLGDTAVTLSTSEESRANWMMRLHLRRLENVYFQYSEGLVDRSALASYGFQNSDRYQTARFKEFWARERDRFNPEFASFFEQKMGIAPAR